MTEISWNKLDFSRERIYIFVFFNSLYAFLPFWIIANLLIQSPMAFVGLITYVIAIYLNLSALRWVVAGDYARADDGNGGGMDRKTVMRLLFGNFIIFLFCIFSIGKGQIIVQDNYGILPLWLVIVGFVIFIITYVISFFLTYVKSEVVETPEAVGNNNIVAEPVSVPKTVIKTDSMPFEQGTPIVQAPVARTDIGITSSPGEVSKNIVNVSGNVQDTVIKTESTPVVQSTPVQTSVVRSDIGMTALKGAGKKIVTPASASTPKIAIKTVKNIIEQSMPVRVTSPRPVDGPNVNDWNVFVDLVTDKKLRNSALGVLRRTSDWGNVCPEEDSYEKKGSAFFQQAVIRSLGDAGEPSTVQFLVELLGKTYDINHGRETFHRPRWPNMGVDVASALARIGQAAVEPLKKSLRSPDTLTRLYTVCSIALLREPSLFTELKEAASQEKDPLVLNYLKRTLAHFERKEFLPPEFNDLRLYIEIVNLKPNIGEPVKCFWITQNIGRAPLIVNIGPTKEVKQIFSVKALYDQTSIFLSPYDSDSTPGPEDLIKLEQDEAFRSGPFDLREYFDLSMPGPYEIHGIYRNHFPGIEYGVYAVEGRLVSEPIVIEINSL